LDCGANKNLFALFEFAYHFNVSDDDYYETQLQYLMDLANKAVLIHNDYYSFEKELKTIARKLLEKLLIFFVDEKFICPIIEIKESDGSNSITLNNYLKTIGRGLRT